MAGDSPSANLGFVLEENSKKISKPRGTVLFRRGEQAAGMFAVLSGNVILDFGVDSTLVGSHGRGTLVGLASATTRLAYSMTATVTEDAELAFLNPEGLDSLLHARPELCQELLVILGKRVAANQDLVQGWLKQPP